MRYDAFISYRHAPLDSFVAQTLHKQLEKFHLPKNLVKTRAANAKKKIERVFRDEEELPLAANLSDPIDAALRDCEFLIVICTPRLLESRWCMKEIDTFIALHGRERVLAVLAEGEPSQSFPPQICFGNIEPLAADVRGRSKKEIVKKIKSEVIRLVAPMFGCSYDDIRQRHREQKLKRGLQISLGASAALLAFGCVSMYQAATISNQKKELQVQYRENLQKQSEILLSDAMTQLETGNKKEALADVMQTLDTVSAKELSAQNRGNAAYVMSELLDVYSDGHSLRPFTSIELESTVEKIIPLNDKRLAAIDGFGTITFFQLGDYETGGAVKLAEYQTNGFELNPQGIDVNSAGTMVYVDEEGIGCISLTDYSQKWYKPYATDCLIPLTDNGDAYIIVNYEKICCIDGNTGEIIREQPVPAEMADYLIFEKAIASRDGQMVYLATSYGDDHINLYAFDTASLTMCCQTSFVGSGVTDMMQSADGTQLVVGYSYFNDGMNVSVYDNYYFLRSMSSDLNTVLWEQTENRRVDGVADPGDGTYLLRGGEKVGRRDAQTGEVVCEYYLSDNVLHVYMFSDGSLCALTRDGVLYFQNMVTGEMLTTPGKCVIENSLEDFVIFEGYYVDYMYNNKKINIYMQELSSYYKELQNIEQAEASLSTAVSFERLNDGEKTWNEQFVAGINEETGFIEVKDIASNQLLCEVPCKARFVRDILIDENAAYLFLQYQDDSLEIYDIAKQQYVTGDYTRHTFGSMDCYIDMSDDYFILKSYATGYVFEKESMTVVAEIPSLYGYDANKNNFIIDDYSQYYYVPFYSLEELVQQTTNE